MRQARAWLPLIGAASLLGSLGMLALPLALAAAVDAVASGRDATGPVALATGLVVLGVLCDLAESWAETACAATTSARLRTGLVRRVLAAPHQVGRFDTGDLVARISAGAADAAHAGPSAVSAAAAVLPPIGSLVILIWLDWRLAAAFGVGLALVAVVLRLFAKQTATAALRYQEAQGQMAARLTEALEGSRTIAAAGTFGTEIRRVLAGLPDLSRYGRATWKALSAAGSRAAIAGPLATVGVLTVAGFLVSTGDLTPGELLAAGQYAMLGAGLGSLTGVVAALARAKAAVGRLAEVHDLSAMSYGTDHLPAGGGRLEFQAVSVSHESTPLLRDVSVTIPGGALAAVVGVSGSGKSILAETAVRLRDPDSGTVTLDGRPLPSLSRMELRRATGLAPARPALAGATLADAMGPGRPRPQVLAAARAVGAHDFATRLPATYDTPLPDIPMSGGEAQRIGLARAWHADRLLVLDDATSSLDLLSARRIEEALAATGRTRLVVTYDAALAARADLVIWLHDGRVRDTGTHEALWADPDYRAVFAQ
ncbi:ABC transporter transmembrane domain-containing protein [Glycomyces terrestris]|uniref:ABC transporter transmembrane domain-containing protein n=1 Tax=Glycomyces terrestris TaxID=2493553 RepID=UPI001E5E0CD7|nr:ABC transporter ATP-binding protein [Glycomyces terrestris]